jgi:hypothetical protein
MSLLSKIRTGLSEREWENLWARVVSFPKFQGAALEAGFENWRTAVIDEGSNRQFIHRAYTGKKIGLRKGIAEVIAEIEHDLDEGKP